MNTDDDTQRLTLTIPPLPEEPPPLEEARSKVIDALGALYFSIRVLEMASWRAGWDKHREWTTIQIKKFAEEAAQENALAARNAAAHETAHSILKVPHHGVATHVDIGVAQTDDRTAAEIVYAYIKERPGKTGVEIVRGLEEIGMGIHERTVRTALFRLKQDKIAAVQNRWYTIEAAREVRLEGLQL